MEKWSTLNHILLCITLFLPAFLLFLHRKKSISGGQRRPPGPRGLPLFGNMFELGSMPHKTLAGLKQRYGPVLWIRIGSINTMVVQSSKAAAELLKNHDITFGDRMLNDVMKIHNFTNASVALAPYGTYWRVMKRMITVEMVINKRINETVSLRRKCVDDLLLWIHKEATNVGKDTEGIQVSRFVFLTSFNMFGNMIFSRDLVKPNSTEGMDFFSGMISLMEWAGHPNIVDLFPCLRWLDPQGLRRNAERDMAKTIQVVSEFVKQCVMERQQAAAGEEKKKDYLQVLLDYEGDGKEESVKLSDHEINILIMEIFLAGTETTSGTIEWAMVELLKNPNTLSKLKAELDEVVGKHRRVEESEIDNLKYLESVVKETFRLHPSLPFLVPRRASQDTNFMGYDIPKDTQVFVNVSAIGRDPEIWEEPERFKPERFLGSDIDFKGKQYELLPFGAGRRICPGHPLAHRMLNLVLGSLVHEFDWDLHESAATKIKDTKERMGVAVRKMEPLIAIPSPKSLYAN